jgi:hypothetical protein
MVAYDQKDPHKAARDRAEGAARDALRVAHKAFKKLTQAIGELEEAWDAERALRDNPPPASKSE